jgi:hypothetical protein
MTRRQHRKARLTKKGDRRGSAAKPHPNSLAARDPALLGEISRLFPVKPPYEALTRAERAELENPSGGRKGTG